MASFAVAALVGCGTPSEQPRGQTFYLNPALPVRSTFLTQREFDRLLVKQEADEQTLGRLLGEKVVVEQKVAEAESALNSSPEFAMLRDESFGFRAYRLAMCEMILRAKLPTAASPFVGRWVDGVAFYDFHKDGTFEWRPGRWEPPSAGKWMDVGGSAILLCYDEWLEEGSSFSAHKFATISGSALRVDQYDYTNNYVRSVEGE